MEGVWNDCCVSYGAQYHEGGGAVRRAVTGTPAAPSRQRGCGSTVSAWQPRVVG